MTAAIAFAVMAGCLFAACSKPPETAEDQVRAMFAAAAKAVRGKDMATLKTLISERYRDDEGRNKDALRGILAYYFLQHRSVHILLRVQSVKLSAPDRATASVIAAMAGTELPDGAIVPSLDADMYRIDIELAAEEPALWRVTRATWRPATVDDFE